MSEPALRRVLMTADAVGGVWQYATDLAAGLAQHGVQTTIALLGPEPPEVGNLPPGVALIRTGLPLDWLAKEPAAVLAAGQAISALAREYGADLLHLNSPALAADAAFPVPVVGACHSCVATWWDAVRGGALPEAFAWQQDLLGRGYRAVDGLLSPSAAFAAATAQRYGLEQVPGVVHNGRRLPPAATVDAPARFVFTAGRLWDGGKDAATLDRAAAQLDMPVIAAGPLTGPNGAVVFLPNLRSIGRIDAAHLAGWMQAAPVFASVARYEPFGLAVLEAAQAGCALVLSAIDSFFELWDGAAVFVPVGNPHALASAIRGVLADDVRRAALGAAARRRAADYGVPSMVAGTLDVYRAAMTRRKSAA